MQSRPKVVFLMYHKIFRSFLCVGLLSVVCSLDRIYTVSETLTVYSLTFIDANYTNPKITFLICCRFLSTNCIRFSTFDILSYFAFVFFSLCVVVFTSYGNYSSSHRPISTIFCF